MYGDSFPPAVVNWPPAYTLLPDTANASTRSFIPEPSADQLLPSHLAMSVAALPPAVVKLPPANTLLPDTASADTEGGGWGRPPGVKREPMAKAFRCRHPSPNPTPTNWSRPIWRCLWQRCRPPY